METTKPIKRARGRLGGWLPQDPKHIDAWIRKLKKSIRERPRSLVEPILEFEQQKKEPGHSGGSRLVRRGANHHSKAFAERLRPRGTVARAVAPSGSAGSSPRPRDHGKAG